MPLQARERPFLDVCVVGFGKATHSGAESNSAIQAQWVERAKQLFNLDGREDEIGTDPKQPGILTSLTYQSVTLPKRGGGNLDESAMELWISKLMTPDVDRIEAEDRESAIPG